MSHFVLVHGAWEESGIWNDVSPVLKQAGHTVTAIDLPGSGVNQSHDGPITTSLYQRAVVELIDEMDVPVVLVAHSMNGALISRVAEQIPDKIARLVYVTSFLLKNGGSVLEAMESDVDGQALPEIVFSENQTYATLPEPALRRIGFHDLDEKTIGRFLPRMAEWQAVEPFMAKVELSERNFGSVPKTYIRTTIDRMVTPALQDRMISNWEVDSVFELESGHFPAFSRPVELGNLLAKAVSKEPAALAGNA